MRGQYRFDSWDEFDLDPSHRPAVVEEIEYAFEAFGIGRGVAATQSYAVARRAGPSYPSPSLEKP